MSSAQTITATPSSASTTFFTATLSSFSGSGSPSRNTTASSSSSSSPPPRPTSNDNAPATFPSSGSDDDDTFDSKHSGLINYYFVFLALLLVLAFGGIYVFQRRRRARKEAYRNSGQNALARDMDGWTGSSRRWMGGHWRGESRTMGATDREGFNELGQAPPPYVAKGHGRETSREVGGDSAEGDEGARNLQIPLRTLARDDMGRASAKPPDYADAVRQDSSAGSYSEQPARTDHQRTRATSQASSARSS